MLLESFMRFEIALILLLLAGCDSGSKPKGQAQPPTSVTSTSVSKPDIGLESSSGLRATLSYAFAGSAAPKVSFAGADGREVELADFAGKPLLVNMWATWCAPCKAEMPTLDALAALESNKVSVIAVSQDLKGLAPVRAYFDQAKIVNLEPYTDSDNRLMAAFNNQIALPTTILYDSDGTEVWRVIGGVEWDDAEMGKLLTEAT
jgi:thiol-disulfide isomerase/thioredoxin